MGLEGFEHASFDGEQLMALLAELDAELGAPSAGSVPYRIAIAGGAAMALRLSDRLTRDVDVVSARPPGAGLARFAGRSGTEPAPPTRETGGLASPWPPEESSTKW